MLVFLKYTYANIYLCVFQLVNNRIINVGMRWKQYHMVCAVCGKSYIATRKGSHYCSDKCRAHASNVRKAKDSSRPRRVYVPTGRSVGRPPGKPSGMPPGRPGEAKHIDVALRLTYTLCKEYLKRGWNEIDVRRLGWEWQERDLALPSINLNGEYRLKKDPDKPFIYHIEKIGLKDILPSA